LSCKHKIIPFVCLILLICVSFGYCCWSLVYQCQYPLFFYLCLFVQQGSLCYIIIKLHSFPAAKRTILISNVLSTLSYIAIRHLAFYYTVCHTAFTICVTKCPNTFKIVVVHILFCCILIGIGLILKKISYI
jgi:hypothetical protein